MRIVILSTLLMLSSFCIAQQKANFKLAQKFKKELEKDRSLNIDLRFLEGSDNFWYSQETKVGRMFYFVNPQKRSKIKLFDNEDLSFKVAELTHKAVNHKKFKFHDLEFDKSQRHITFSLDGNKYKYGVYSKKLEIVKDKKEAKKNSRPIYSYMCFSPDKKYYVYAKKHNLFLKGDPDKTTDTLEVQLTFDGERYFSYAKNGNDTTSSEQETNVRWFKNSKKIYIVREDESKLEDMYVINPLGDGRPELKTYRYEMPGDQNITQYKLTVIDITTKKIVKVNADRWDGQYIEVKHATKDASKIYFERYTRGFDEVELCVANTETGEVKGLIHEIDKPYVDYHMRRIDFLNDGEEIIWRSERTGWGHYYLYDKDGKLKRQMTSGAWVAGQIQKIDTLNRTMYIYGYGREKDFDPYYYIMYRVNMDNGQIYRMTDENANHSVSISHSNKYIVDRFSRVDLEPRIYLKDINGKIIMKLAEIDVSDVMAMGWKKPIRFKVKAADEVTDLYGVMWLPADFDENKKYPIISNVYPGPFYEYVPTSFTLKHEHNTLLAQLGFVVVTVGHRGGTPMRGKFYHTYSNGKLRDYPLADDKYAIEQLAQKYPFIDIDKVGIYGHSGGGFMSAAAILTYPDFYTAAVASAGNHDNRIFNRGWTEIHHGVRYKMIKEKSGKNSQEPDSENEIIEKKQYYTDVRTNMELAKNLKGHLMLFTGCQDNNVHPAHTYRLAEALIKAGKNFDLEVLPDSKHGFFGDDGKYFEKKMWFHFVKYLLNDNSCDDCVDLNNL